MNIRDGYDSKTLSNGYGLIASRPSRTDWQTGSCIILTELDSRETQNRENDPDAVYRRVLE